MEFLANYLLPNLVGPSDKAMVVVVELLALKG